MLQERGNLALLLGRPGLQDRVALLHVLREVIDAVLGHQLFNPLVVADDVEPSTADGVVEARQRMAELKRLGHGVDRIDARGGHGRCIVAGVTVFLEEVGLVGAGAHVVDGHGAGAGGDVRVLPQADVKVLQLGLVRIRQLGQPIGLTVGVCEELVHRHRLNLRCRMMCRCDRVDRDLALDRARRGDGGVSARDVNPLADSRPGAGSVCLRLETGVNDDVGIFALPVCNPAGALLDHVGKLMADQFAPGGGSRVVPARREMDLFTVGERLSPHRNRRVALENRDVGKAGTEGLLHGVLHRRGKLARPVSIVRRRAGSIG